MSSRGTTSVAEDREAVRRAFASADLDEQRRMMRVLLGEVADVEAELERSPEFAHGFRATLRPALDGLLEESGGLVEEAVA